MLNENKEKESLKGSWPAKKEKKGEPLRKYTGGGTSKKEEGNNKRVRKFSKNIERSFRAIFKRKKERQ